eukprot:10309256-Prorocentrum_lima.AAC.1
MWSSALSEASTSLLHPFLPFSQRRTHQLLPPLGMLVGCSTGARSSRDTLSRTLNGIPMGSSTPWI